MSDMQFTIVLALVNSMWHSIEAVCMPRAVEHNLIKYSSIAVQVYLRQHINHRQWKKYSIYKYNKINSNSNWQKHNSSVEQEAAGIQTNDNMGFDKHGLKISLDEHIHRVGYQF